MTPPSDHLVIAQIPKNSREVIVVRRTTFHGKPFVDLRVFVDIGGGELRPSQKGVAIRPDLIDQVVAALLAAERGQVPHAEEDRVLQ